MHYKYRKHFNTPGSNNRFDSANPSETIWVAPYYQFDKDSLVVIQSPERIYVWDHDLDPAGHVCEYIDAEVSLFPRKYEREYVKTDNYIDKGIFEDANGNERKAAPLVEGFGIIYQYKLVNMDNNKNEDN